MHANHSYVAVFDNLKQLNEAIDFIEAHEIVTDNASILTTLENRINQKLTTYPSPIACCPHDTPTIRQQAFSETAIIQLPRFGHLLMSGPIVKQFLWNFETFLKFDKNAALGATLYNLGIPRQGIEFYESALRNRQSLLLFQGNVEELEHVYYLLADSSALDMNMHYV